MLCVGTYYVTKLGVHRHYAHFFLKVPTVAVRAAIPVAMELAEMILRNLLVNLYFFFSPNTTYGAMKMIFNK